MQIPKKIKVGKKLYTIEMHDHVQVNGKFCMGGVSYATSTIRIGTYRPSTGRALPEKELVNTFWHELTHAILEDMGSRLEADEKFVDAFSTRLSNAVRSARF